jgi:hypothetical protein
VCCFLFIHAWFALNLCVFASHTFYPSRVDLIDWCLTSSEQFFSYIQDEGALGHINRASYLRIGVPLLRERCSLVMCNEYDAQFAFWTVCGECYSYCK